MKAVGLAVWAYGVIDAPRAARRHNEQLGRGAGPADVGLAPRLRLAVSADGRPGVGFTLAFPRR